MNNFRGICTKCGIAHSDQNHSCSDDDVRLVELDRQFGPRAVREFMLVNGFKGHVKEGKELGVIEEAEAEAILIRAKK